jgi:hypothetical protein
VDLTLPRFSALSSVHSNKREKPAGVTMIYTIGYECLSPIEFVRIVRKMHAVVIDGRFIRGRAKRGFGVLQLEAALGDQYEWHGNILGGFNNITRTGVTMLRNRQEHETLLLVCMEEAPGECHRHNGICHPHFPEAVHIFRDELILARDLQDSFSMPEETADYPLWGTLSDLLADSG